MAKPGAISCAHKSVLFLDAQNPNPSTSALAIGEVGPL
jgi:hypothetical protein